MIPAGDEVGCRLLSGFGRAGASAGRIRRPRDQADVSEALAAAARDGAPVIARGLGRSYGDAAQCSGGTVIDCSGLDAVHDADWRTGTLRLGAGVSLTRLLELAVPRGWFPPVTPGTASVSIGGAIAADVHGKNHHRDSSFGAFVARLVLETPAGSVPLDPEQTPEHFWATVGAMGLTGVISEATIRLRPIESARLRVETRRADDLDQCMAILAAADENAPYSVAWVDGTARGKHLGRSVITLADHARRDELPVRQRADALSYRPRRPVPVPATPPVNLVTAPVVAAFNEAYFRRAPARARTDLATIGSYFYPLDVLASWNRLYGPRGFTQYQFVVPFAADGVVRRAFELLQGAHQTPTLVVLKRFGAADRAPLSFPRPGWTVAIDLALGAPGLPDALDRLDELVATAGGRVYLAKDGRLRPELVPVMYPRLAEFASACATLDPTQILASDLSRRLRIRGERAGGVRREGETG